MKNVKPRNRKRKKVEFSKKIFIGVSITTAVVTGFTLAAIWKTGDNSPLAYLIPAVFAELATATGFYYRKAQKENEIKLPHYMAGQTPTSDEETTTDETIQ